mmetsp:Transcript_27369/g.56840  ORF Transcript_27369/g.56840 Transcript_27369/m.56840 type:complete len:232 (+) Transcript_27369:58-753(+)
MSSRLRGLEPPADWLGGRSFAKTYDWLKPCETHLALAQREGPLRRARPERYVGTMGDLEPAAAEIPAGAGRTAGSRVAPKRRCKRRGDGIWAAGTQGPVWQPPSAEERAWRLATTTAVQAATAARATGSRPAARIPRSASCPGTQRLRTAGTRLVQETPGAEAWDSVSQAPSTPGTPQGYRQGSTEVMSAETATASRAYLSADGQVDRDMAQHLTRNRRGWYDWHGGRLFG